MIPYVITNKSVTIYFGDDLGQQTVDQSHPNFEEIKETIFELETETAGTTMYDLTLEDLKDLVNVATAITKWGQGLIEVKDGEVFYDGKAVHNVVTDRIIDAVSEGREPKTLAKFLERLLKNPSYAAVEELYLFLEHNDIVITDDGHFLAYKKVRNNYTDIHSGTFDNSVGKFCAMKRNEVDDNRNRTCSAGLHFCAKHYLPSFGSYHGTGGDRIMVVKVNPADVVSIPNDYNNAKGRTWRYQVVAEAKGEGSLKEFQHL